MDATSAQTLASLAMVLKRMDVELVLTRVTKPSIRRLLVAHGIISPKESKSSSNRHMDVAAGTDAEQQQPLFEQDDQEEEDEEEAGRYCRVFDTLSAGAKYAEDK